MSTLIEEIPGLKKMISEKVFSCPDLNLVEKRIINYLASNQKHYNSTNAEIARFYNYKVRTIANGISELRKRKAFEPGKKNKLREEFFEAVCEHEIKKIEKATNYRDYYFTSATKNLFIKKEEQLTFKQQTFFGLPVWEYDSEKKELVIKTHESVKKTHTYRRNFKFQQAEDTKNTEQAKQAVKPIENSRKKKDLKKISSRNLEPKGKQKEDLNLKLKSFEIFFVRLIKIFGVFIKAFPVFTMELPRKKLIFQDCVKAIKTAWLQRKSNLYEYFLTIAYYVTNNRYWSGKRKLGMKGLSWIIRDYRGAALKWMKLNGFRSPKDFFQHIWQGKLRKDLLDSLKLLPQNTKKIIEGNRIAKFLEKDPSLPKKCKDPELAQRSFAKARRKRDPDSGPRSLKEILKNWDFEKK